MKFQAKMVASNGAITVVIDGKPYTVDNGHINYLKLRDAVKADNAAEFINLVDVVQSVQQTIQAKSSGKVTLVGETIHYDGQPMHNEMTRRFIQLLKEGEDITYLLRFIEKLMSNPSKRAIDELYTFLSHKNLPITEDGDFLAYKCVRDNYLDKHSGKFDNKPGAVMEMQRNQVDDNCNNTCSYGFHAGSLEYSGPGGAFYQSGDKVVIVKINPADVVSIPSDYQAQKLRTCKYVVLSDYKGALSKAVYSGKGVKDEEYDENEYDAAMNELYDENYEDAIEPDDLIEGDFINFGYSSDGVTKIRYVEVTNLDWKNRLMTGKLAHPEPNAGDYRSFHLDEMENIVIS